MLSTYELKKGRKKEALRLFEELYPQKPKNDSTQYQLGALYLMNDQPQRTLHLWEDLFYRGNRSPDFVFSLALAYFQTQKYEQAKKLLNHLQFFAPREPGVSFLLGEVYRRQGRLEDAIRTYRTLLAEYPRYINAYLGLVMALLERKDVPGARAVLKDAAASIANPAELEQIQTVINSNPEAITEEYETATAKK